MSPLTFWLAIGALVPIALVVVNAIAYRRRFGTFHRSEQRPHAKRTLSKVETALAIIPALALLVCVAAPAFAPASPFTLWLLEPYSRAVFVVWCFVATIVLGIAPTTYAHFISRKRQGAQ
jgi:hypothetical protein